MDLKHFIIALALTVTSVANASQSIWLYNVTERRVKIERNADVIRPIASITKIMTAMVALEHSQDLQKQLTLSNRVGGYLPQRSYSRYDLLTAMLVRSDNAAAETLAQDFPGGRRAFVEAMNQTAKKYNLESMQFDDPTGLSRKNLATARDVGMLMQVAAQHWLIRFISIRQQIEFDINHGRKNSRLLLVNTNQPVLFEFSNIVLSKTGLTTPAGWCVGLVAEQNQKQYVIIILGSKTKQERMAMVQDMMYNHLPEKNMPTLTVLR